MSRSPRCFFALAAKCCVLTCCLSRTVATFHRDNRSYSCSPSAIRKSTLELIDNINTNSPGGTRLDTRLFGFGTISCHLWDREKRLLPSCSTRARRSLSPADALVTEGSPSEDLSRARMSNARGQLNRSSPDASLRLGTVKRSNASGPQQAQMSYSVLAIWAFK